MTTTPAVGRISSGYGRRKRPRKPDGTLGSAMHRGVDIAGPAGTHVVAPEAGIVTHIASSALRGLYVVIDHGRFETLHQHLDSVTVDQGEHVAEGRQIGVMGTSGGVARHLHTEVHDGTTPIDPSGWYAARGVTLGVARAGAPAPRPTTSAAPPAARPHSTPTPVPEEDDDMARLIRHPNGRIALVGPGPRMTVVRDMDEVGALRMTGAVTDVAPGVAWQQLPDGLAWDKIRGVAQRAGLYTA